MSNGWAIFQTSAFEMHASFVRIGHELSKFLIPTVMALCADVGMVSAAISNIFWRWAKVRSQVQLCSFICAMQQLRSHGAGRGVKRMVSPKKEVVEILIAKMLWSPTPYKCGKHMPCPISNLGLPNTGNIGTEPWKSMLGMDMPIIS